VKSVGNEGKVMIYDEAFLTAQQVLAVCHHHSLSLSQLRSLCRSQHMQEFRRIDHSDMALRHASQPLSCLVILMCVYSRGSRMM
jgi:hypothetical protein